jgi:pimeloyl-ACP methyl ester carboxylesterase
MSHSELFTSKDPSGFGDPQNLNKQATAEVVGTHDPERSSVQSRLIPTQLFMRESGTGTPLLLIHGLMVNGEMYQPVLPALAMHHRVIVPDLRGHGRSGNLPGPYDVEQLAGDLAQFLDELQIDVADVLGYSQGGAVAQQFARDHPRRVRGLVLACTYSYNMLSRRERLEGMLMPWLIRILGIGRLARLVSAGGGGPRLPPETVHWLQGIMATNDLAHMLPAVEAMKTFDSRPWLHQIGCPTLVIAGAEDTAVPLPHARMLVQGIPDVELKLVDGAGHALIWTHTEALVQVVEAFLEPLRDRRKTPDGDEAS